MKAHSSVLCEASNRQSVADLNVELLMVDLVLRLVPVLFEAFVRLQADRRHKKRVTLLILRL